MTGLVEHFEHFLGPIDRGAQGDGSTPAGVQVIRFGPDAPFSGVTTWATLGLSNHHLSQSSERGLHQELVMHLPNDREPDNLAGVLFQVAGELLGRGRGVGAGASARPASVVLTWLVPLTDAEATFAHTHGWPALEEVLVAQDPDLTDLGRPSLQL